MELAVATNTAPADWWDEPAATIVTALDVLNRNADRIERTRKHGK